MVAVSGPGLEPGAHSRCKRRFPGVRHQHGVAFQDIDELVLPGVRMAHRRDGARPEAGQVDAEIGQAEYIAQRALSRPATREANGSG